MSGNLPLVSIVIVNFNGKRWLKNCFESINNQVYPNLEVIVVDNNSTDNSVAYIKKYPEYKLIENKNNLGFAEGNNIGVSNAKGDFYFLLNNDTVLIESDLISKAISFLLKNKKIGVLQPKICLLAHPGKIDLCGSFWTPTTMLYHYGCYQDEKLKMFDHNFPVFTCKGAAMFVRKTCVDNVGLFDPDFWCYYEETDFCHRVWLDGFECWYFSETKLLHANGGTSQGFRNDFIQYHNFKNKLRSFINNFRGLERVAVIFKFTLTAILYCALSIANKRPRNINAVFAAYWWNIKKLFAKNNKLVPIHKAALPSIVIKNPGIRYYFDLVKDLKKHKYDENV